MDRSNLTVYDLAIDALPPLLLLIVFITDHGWLAWVSLAIGILSAVFFLIPDAHRFYNQRKDTDEVESD